MRRHLGMKGVKVSDIMSRKGARMKWLRSAASLGCVEGGRPSVNRPILMTNISAMIAMSTHLAYGIFYMLEDMRVFWPVIAVSATAIPVLLSSLLLNHMGKPLAASLVMNLSTQFFVFVSLFAFLGNAIGNQYFFILFSLLPLITLPRKVWQWQLALSVLAIVFFFLTFRHTPPMNLAATLSDSVLLVTYDSSALLSLVAVVITTGVYQRILGISEETLEDQNIVLGKAVETVTRLAATDALTGLHNRRSMDELLALEMRQAEQVYGALSLILLDVDHFKDINDAGGHEAGDYVLKELALLLLGNVRRSDHCGRWGGEEFLVILPKAGTAEAGKVAEKIRLALDSRPFRISGRVSASFGVTSLRPGDSRDALIRRVDRAMYQAKRAGRNRVHIDAGTEVASRQPTQEENLL